jgi:hypothetical protein
MKREKGKGKRESEKQRGMRNRYYLFQYAEKRL